MLVLALYLLFTRSTHIPDGMMILVEYDDDMTGLYNFVYEMHRRDIQGILMLDSDYITRNCDYIKQLLTYGNIELAGAEISEPFWGVPYDEQYSKISDLKNTFESCTGVPLRIVASRYMSSDPNTIKVAKSLGIPYLLARGTLGLRAGTYYVSDEGMTLLSVSNIEDPYFKYGSMCDYSFFERGGTTTDMERTLSESLVHPKITPVTHTRIGGNVKEWYDMWMRFFDSGKVNWVGIDEMMAEIDYTMELWQIPINQNAPYGTLRPIIPYDDATKVGNICPLCI